MKKWKKVKEVSIVGCVLGSFYIIDSWSNLGSIQWVRKGSRRSTRGKTRPQKSEKWQKPLITLKNKKTREF